MSNSKKIKVLVIVGNMPEARPIISKNGVTMYDGLYYNMWDLIKSQLKDTFDFEETYMTQEESVTYDNQIQMVADGKYDICIDGFNTSPTRLKIVNFTESLMLEKNAILHYPNKAYWTSILEIITNIYLKPFIILLIICSLIGLYLNYIEPGRWNGMNINPKLYIRKTILMTISIIFGQGGVLESTKLYTIQSLFIIIILLFISTIFIAYIQAILTARVIKVQSDELLNINDTIKRPILSQYGNIISQNIQKLGVEIKQMNGSFDDLINHYKKYPDKYSGIVISSIEGKYYTTKYNEFILSDQQFGYFNIHFPINKNQTELLNKVNIAIQYLHNIGKFNDICKIYQKYVNPSLCNVS